jgi:hypothetical protein
LACLAALAVQSAFEFYFRLPGGSLIPGSEFVILIELGGFLGVLGGLGGSICLGFDFVILYRIEGLPGALGGLGG